MGTYVNKIIAAVLVIAAAVQGNGRNVVTIYEQILEDLEGR